MTSTCTTVVVFVVVVLQLLCLHSRVTLGLYAVMSVPTASPYERILWTNGTDMITWSLFDNSSPTSVIKVNSETGFTVSRYTATVNSVNTAVSWIDCVNNVHKYVFTIGSDGDPSSGYVPTLFIPTDPSRVYVLFDKSSGSSPTIQVFGTVVTMNTNTLYYSLWDLSSGVPFNVWYHLYSLPVLGTFFNREFYETGTHLIAGAHSTPNYINTIGSAATFNCGGLTHWVHKIDRATGVPVWSGRYGSAASNAPSDRLALHPTRELFCGFISFNGGFGTNCDLDFTATVNVGEANPSPGNPTNFWSLFLFCQDVSSNTGVLPPAWTHTISSTGNDASSTWVVTFYNGWGGNDILVQAVARGQGTVTQGLQWPTTDGGYSFGSSTGSSVYNVYVWARNLGGATIWSKYFPVSDTQVVLGLGSSIGCPNVGLLIYSFPISSYDYSNGINPSAGTYAPTTNSVFLLILRASDGQFVSLVDFGPTLTIFAGDVKVDNSTCDFVCFVYKSSVQRGTCTWSSGNYKVMMRLNQTGSILDTPIDCYPTQSATGTFSISATATTSLTPTPSLTQTPSATVTQTASLTPKVTASSPQPVTTSTPKVTPVSKDDFDSTKAVDKSTTRISNTDLKQGVDIPLTVTDGNQKSEYGVVSIPPGLIPVGWTVVISRVNENDLVKPKIPSDACGNDKQENDENGGIRSIAFNLVVLDERGRERSLQQLVDRAGKGIGISLAYSLSESERKHISEKDLKYIFLENGDESWQVSNEDVEITGMERGFGNISTTVNHLTGFAVLLGGGSSFGDSCSDNTIWILSVSFLASACVFSVLVILLMTKVPYFNRYSTVELEKQLKQTNYAETVRNAA